MDDRLTKIERELGEVREILGEPPNAATGAPGSGMQLVLAKLADGQNAAARRIGAFIAVGALLIEAVRFAVPWASLVRPAQASAVSSPAQGGSR